MTRPPSADTFLERLRRGRGASASMDARVRTDDQALDAAAGDESGHAPQRPLAVVYPETTEEVRLIAENAAELGIGLVPRGAGTGKAGACVPRAQDVVVDLSGMNRVLEMRPQDLYARVQPGLITAELDREAGHHGFMYPPDPASWESSSLGGNIATNAGGPRAVKYGVTHRYVWGLELVLPGGRVVRTGRHSIKGVAGLDLTSLLVGSEGTLGFITEATMHIIPAPPEVETGWLVFPDPITASRATERIFGAGLLPRMLEMMDRLALDAVRPISTFRIPENAGAALLVETDGRDGTAMADLLRLCEIAAEHGATDSAIARSETEREAMRRARRVVSSCLKERFPQKLSDDIAVPRSRMHELLLKASEEAEKSGILVSAYGHLGDGNLHVNLLCSDAEQRREVAPAVRERVLRFAVEMGGTVSGEHGIGLTKREQLPLEQSEFLIDLQRNLKSVFDPRGVMNPGKVWIP